jgi:hypothetical protein
VLLIQVKWGVTAATTDVDDGPVPDPSIRAEITDW